MEEALPIDKAMKKKAKILSILFAWFFGIALSFFFIVITACSRLCEYDASFYHPLFHTPWSLGVIACIWKCWFLYPFIVLTGTIAAYFLHRAHRPMAIRAGFAAVALMLVIMSLLALEHILYGLVGYSIFGRSL
jgi:hypothetical protein